MLVQMLRVGDTAPEIDREAISGEHFVLSRRKAHLTVIYFFPKAFTPGCTRETQLFRDNHVEIKLAGADVVGISTDDQKTQCDFARSTGAKFPMISDHDRAISAAYGVLWPVVGLPRRVTFVVGEARRIEAVFHHELSVEKHRDDVLLFVDKMWRERRGE